MDKTQGRREPWHQPTHPEQEHGAPLGCVRGLGTLVALYVLLGALAALIASVI